MESKTKIFGHSAHQIAIVWPLGLLSTSVAYDLAALRGNPKAAQAAFSLLGAGLAGGLVAFGGGWLGGELVSRLGVGVDDGAHLDAPNSLSGQPASLNAGD